MSFLKILVNGNNYIDNNLKGSIVSWYKKMHFFPQIPKTI